MLCSSFHVGYLKCADQLTLQSLLLWLAGFLPAVLAGYLDGSSGEESISKWYPLDANGVARHGSTSQSLGSAPESEALLPDWQSHSIRHSPASGQTSDRDLGSPTHVTSMVKSSDGLSVQGDMLTLNPDYSEWYFLVFREATRRILPAGGALMSAQRRWTSKEDKLTMETTLNNRPPEFHLLSKFDAAPPQCFYDDRFVSSYPDLIDMNRDIWLPVRRTERYEHSIKLPNLQDKLVYIFDSECEMLYKSPRLTVFEANRWSPLVPPHGGVNCREKLQ